MNTILKRCNKDHAAALLLTLVGAGVIWEGSTYHVGSLQRMGSGFVPVTLGLLLLLVGLAIGLTARSKAAPSVIELPSVREAAQVEWRGKLCILGGVAAFVVLGEYGGLVPATFGATLISALGDRGNSLRDAVLLALAMVVAGTLIFSVGLHLQMPLFRWGN